MQRLQISSPRGLNIFDTDRKGVGNLEEEEEVMDISRPRKGRGDGQRWRPQHRRQQSITGGGMGQLNQKVQGAPAPIGRTAIFGRGRGEEMTPNKRDTYVSQVGRDRVPFGRRERHGVYPLAGSLSPVPRYDNMMALDSPSWGVGDGRLAPQVVVTAADGTGMAIEGEDELNTMGSTYFQNGLEEKKRGVRFNANAETFLPSPKPIERI